MDKAAAPIEMLEKCRRFFRDEAAVYRQTERICGSMWEKKVAGEFAATYEKFIAEIDATLRDWG
jgi:hypothetical protein